MPRLRTERYGREPKRTSRGSFPKTRKDLGYTGEKKNQWKYEDETVFGGTNPEPEKPEA